MFKRGKNYHTCYGLPAGDMWRVNRDEAEWRREAKGITDSGAVSLYACNMCGGLKKDSVADLLEAGGALEPSTKDYKFYITPDGQIFRGHFKYYRYHKDDGSRLAVLRAQLVNATANPFCLVLPKFKDNFMLERYAETK